MNYILAHDLGTSGNKAVLYREEGTPVSDAFSGYRTYHPEPGFVEQEPAEWWTAVCAATRTLIANSGIGPAEIAAISFSGQMMGCVVVDSAGIPLRRSIIWADTRSTREEREISDRIDPDRIYRITGHRLSASYSAAKLLWIRNNEPLVYERIHKMVQAKDYIAFRMTGEFVTDFSDASGTNLFDLRRKRWSPEILDAIGISEDILPAAVASTTVVGRVEARIANEVGLAAGTPVVIGGGDGACATVGAGIVQSGRAYNVMGTSSWIAMASEKPVFDSDRRTFTFVHLDPDLYMPCGTMQGAGFSYNWFVKNICEQPDAKAMEDSGSTVHALVDGYVRESPPGANGLLFLPYLLGERSPWWQPDARAAFVGLGASHTKKDMARAVLEGVAHNLRIILNTFDEAVCIDELVVIGGAVRRASA